MQEWDDNALLRTYVESESEEAFTTLVTRHVAKVHSTALRHTRNSHQAEDITQAVFVTLAIKAPQLSPKVILSGWLYQTTRLTALTWTRAAIRRTRREFEGHRQAVLEQNDSDIWTQIAPLLDSAIAELSEKDRSAVVLRFFDVKNLKEVGLALGASEEAAKKRVNRALEKLRAFFLRHGVNSTTALLAENLSMHSVQAVPAGLAKTIAAAALRKGAICGQVSTLLKGTIKYMAWSKTKIAAVSAFSLLFIGGVTTVALNKNADKPVLGAPSNVGFNKVFLGPENPGIELYSDPAPPAIVEDPTAGNGEEKLRGWHYWFNGVKGKGFLFVDNTDAATGANDLTLGNTAEGPENHADWRSQKFNLGPATNGNALLTFSFAYKIPGPVKDGDNIQISLRFIDSGGHKVLAEKTVLIGFASHDSNMARYKQVTLEDIRPPKNAQKADVRILANLEGQTWTSGPARFDDFAVVGPSKFWGKIFH